MFGAMAMYHLHTDLDKAQVAAALLAGSYGDSTRSTRTSTPFTISITMDVACFHSFQQLRAMLDWLAVQCPLRGADRSMQLLREDDMMTYFHGEKTIT